MKNQAKILKQFLTSDIRENRLFALSTTIEYIQVAETLYRFSKREELIEIIDNLYEFIEKYDINKKYNNA
jgi:hypothetical protein